MGCFMRAAAVDAWAEAVSRYPEILQFGSGGQVHGRCYHAGSTRPGYPYESRLAGGIPLPSRSPRAVMEIVKEGKDEPI